jgi:hypothetical protein
MNKRCSSCKEEKYILEFNKDRSSKDGYAGRCRVCQNKASAKYRAENLEFCNDLARKQAAKILAQNRGILIELKTKPCEECGRLFPSECMDFDHINPKTKLFDPSGGFWKGIPIEKLMDEVAKCRLLCCYCHATKTYLERISNGNDNQSYNKKHYLKKQAVINEIKEKNSCQICGKYFDHWLMQFDHLDKQYKTDCVSNILARHSLDVALKEIEKCQLLCIGCHRIITRQRQLTK